MRIKRIFLPCAVCLMAVCTLIASASAHGGHHSSVSYSGQHTQVQQTVISVCPVEGCTLAGRHVHNGTVYCGYDHGSGYCNGACLALCTVENCTLSGRHVHNNVTYCGNYHTCGFCDGSCSVYYYYRGCHH